MAGSSSGSLFGWSDWGGRHFQSFIEAHPIVQAWGEEEMGQWGDSREQPQTERLGDRCQGGGRDHPLRWKHRPNLVYPQKTLFFFFQMHV